MAKQIIKKSVLTLLILLTFFMTVISAATTVHAEESATLKFDESNVLDDLEGSTINGEPFNLEKYNFDIV